jgi:hypothetical protein
MIVPAPHDPIRIVPLHLPEEVTRHLPEVTPAPAAQLTYRNGPLLTSVEVFTVFWGPAWEQSPLSATVQQINDFYDYLLTSPLIDQLAEYNTGTYKIGHGKRTGTITITTPHLRHSVSDRTIQHTLQHEVLTNLSFPQPGPNVLYAVYLPPGVAVVQGGSSSCKAFCGYHNDVSGQLFYSVLPYPNCQGCMGGMSPFDSLTTTSSHELCEAITDPIPGQGWYDDTNGEIGDICAWKTKKLGQYTVQLEWSNNANTCI